MQPPTQQQQPKNPPQLALKITPLIAPSIQLPIQDKIHHDSCSCKICQKEQEINNYKKYKSNFSQYLQTIYQNDFITKKAKKQKKNKNKQVQQSFQDTTVRKKQRSFDLERRSQSVQYVDLQSTYGKQFITKKVQVAKMRPLDNLGGISAYIPNSTTYMRSYHSTLTPKPDQPFKTVQMPIGNTMAFNSQSIYQKSYKNEYQPRPNLPFIHRQALSKPKSIGTFESTQKKSYSSSILNPEGIVQPIKPMGNIKNLASFAHNYDTTYRNFFVPSSKKIEEQKCGIDQIGNIYRRNNIYRI